MILAADIGGTNTRLALLDQVSGRLVMRRREEFKNGDDRALEEIIEQFLRGRRRGVGIAAIGVAGPVKDGKAVLTNLHWKLDEKHLSSDLGVDRVLLINDLVAHAEGISLLRKLDQTSLHKGTPTTHGSRAIIAPGTGLGEAGIVYDDSIDDYRAIASEGGHCDFAPRDAREIGLMNFVRTKFGRCSWEDVLSGPGLRTIWDFLVQDPEHSVRASLRTNDPTPSDITGAANKRSCKACITAVEIFAELCGSEAGNLALKFLATGGVWIGGGIAPHVLKFLKKDQVRNAFVAKGPQNIRKLLQAIPIHVITTPDNALYGAARYALRQ